jgi:hypothetical protein
MAKGQHLSRYQQGIVKRYYEHMDAATSQKLAELVSEIYLADGENAASKLWKSAATALAKTPAEPEKVAKIVASRDVKALAALVADLSPGGRLTR